MDEKMKTALLQWCEKHTKVLNDDFCEALEDLVETVVTTTETPIDDMIVLPIKEPVFNVLHEYLETQIDKIDGIEGNLGAV